MMKHLQWSFVSGLVWTSAFFGVVGPTQAKPCKLELVRLEAIAPGARMPAGAWRYRNVSSQRFFMQIHKSIPPRQFERDFKKVVTKEPEQYISIHPFRCVAELGSKKYGFVLDQKDEESYGYNRLYFDLNGNGDLTDDEPIDAIAPKPPKDQSVDTKTQEASATTKTSSNSGDAKAEKKEDKKKVTDEEKEKQKEKEKQEAKRRKRSRPISVSHRFPRADLTLDVDGKKLDYSFFFQVYSQHRKEFQYASASLKSAVYSRGEITLDGNSFKIAVLDYNSNGRFDDRMQLRESRGGEGQLYPQVGDMLLIDPDRNAPSAERTSLTPNQRRQYLSKLNAFGGKFYEVEVSPVGEDLTWTASTAPLGQITSPHAPCQVTLFGKQGYLPLKLEKSPPAKVPVGQWRVLSYNLRVENWTKPEKKDEADQAEKDKKIDPSKPSLTGNLKKKLLELTTSMTKAAPRRRPRISTLSARGTSHGEPVIVEADQTATLKFGPPYALRVKVNSYPGTAQLGLVMQGSNHEVVSGLSINGRRPPKPAFTITDPNGEVVVKGNFEYG